MLATRIMACVSSKFFDLDVGDRAVACMIAFEAKAAIDATTGDENLKRRFLAKCDVDAISKLRNLLFLLLIENNDCTCSH